MAINEITFAGMEYNRITLAFPRKQESGFLVNYFRSSLTQFRISFVLVAVMYGIFGYLDSRMVPEFAIIFQIIRFVFVVPLLLFVLIISYTKYFLKIWQELLLISFIIAGTGISIMTMLVPENYAYYAGMMLIFSAGYFFIKLRFFYSTLAG